MTDAREIIAHHLCEMAAQGWSGISPFERAAYRTTAQGMVGAIESAGFRILGPDEVDQVTVERCAEIASCQFDDRGNGRSGHYSEMDWTEGYRDATRAAAATIRAIGRKV